MTEIHRARRVAFLALLPTIALVLAACAGPAPNSIWNAHSDFGHSVDHLTRFLVYLGAGVFVLVEGLLLYVLVRFRRREQGAQPQNVHGNTVLEVTWTAIPAVILAVIAVPTVKTIFAEQAEAPASSLQVEVIGHQWWWEFRYPEYKVTTANELYLPVGRTVNFALKSGDVLHSFWIPKVSGKRDLISNHTNHLWFTPDSSFVWNGFCAEFCGASHSNMRFRVFTVPPDQFAQWIAHEQTGPAFVAPAAAAPAAGDSGKAAAAAPAPPPPPPATVAEGPTGAVTLDKMPRWTVPATPLPAGLTVSEVQGDAARGATMFKTATCIACHAVQGVSAGIVGPNLTHVGSRTTIAAGLYPNDQRHLMYWIKNAPVMKPGSIMPALGKTTQNPGGYNDQQIADLAAYLSSLK